MARSYHPPKPSPYEPPSDDNPGYIMGASGVQGFGKCGLYLAAIPAARAREVVIARHYSHRVVNNSYVHLGVYHQDNSGACFSSAMHSVRAERAKWWRERR